MDPWYKIVTPRKEVREGRSFNPDEFAIALDQVVDGKAPADYQDPEQFFSRTYFTQSPDRTHRHGPEKTVWTDREAPPRYSPSSPSSGVERPTR